MPYYPFATESGAFYRLTNPNGAVATFNDQLDPNYVGMLNEVTGLDSPEVRESADELVESDGGTHGNFYFGRRPVVLSGRVFGHGTVLERNIRLDRARRASMALRSDSTLSWFPSKSITNLISNPRAANNTAGWVTTTLTGQTTGSTITRVTGVTPLSGTTALDIATTTTANQGAAFPINVVAGKTYFVGVYARRTSGTGVPEIYISSVGISGPLVSLNNSTSFLLSVASFTPTTSGQAYIVFRDPSTSATTFQISDVVVSTKNIGYFDGDSNGFYWQGDPHASTSGDYIEMFTTVRRQQPFRESGAWNKDFQIALVSEYAPVFSTGLKIASGAGGSAVSVENRGSWPSSPLLRIAGISSTNPTISNTTTGLAVTTMNGIQVVSGEVLEIDTLNHTAYFTAGTRNGQSANRYIDYGNSTWPTIPTGVNSFTLSGSGTLTVAYRDTWI
jgi:hypothetical protein